MSAKIESNSILESALNYRYPAYTEEKGLNKVVAFGEHSHKCPVYTLRTPPCTAACPSGEDIRGYNNILRGVEKSKNDLFPGLINKEIIRQKHGIRETGSSFPTNRIQIAKRIHGPSLSTKNFEI